jgi:hypothetical protein
VKKLLFPLCFLILIFIINCNQKEEKHANLKDDQESVKTTDSIIINKIDSTQIPASIRFEGKLKKAIQWKDEVGDNLVILSETGYHRSEKFKHEFDDSSDFELFAYHFTLDKNNSQQIWKMYDFVADCPVDIEAEFYSQFPMITDLDKNGIAEVWIMYKVGCHGDVSPVNLKLIMYEGNKKYAMRGENKVQVGANEYLGGEYKFDKAFNSAPITFKNYAIKLWKDNIYKN